MEKLINEYHSKIGLIDMQIKNRERLIRDTRGNSEMLLENEIARTENKVFRSNRQLLVQVIKDIEDYA